MRHVEHVIGTAVTIDLPDGTDIDLLVDTIERLHHVEERFTVYSAESQISQIGRGALSISEADSDVRSVIDACDELHHKTSGAFSHRYGTPDLPLDPSGYVKGWAIDQVADCLRDAGIERYFINAGGDIVAFSAGEPWRIGVRHPSDPASVGGVLETNDLAVATSGSYERGGHVWGADYHQLTSVTVTGPRLGTADALATALWSIDRANPDWMNHYPDYDILSFDVDDRRHRTVGLELIS